MTGTESTDRLKLVFGSATPWLVCQFLPRHRFSVILGKFVHKSHAHNFLESLCTANSALRPVLCIEHVDTIDLRDAETQPKTAA